MARLFTLTLLLILATVAGPARAEDVRAAVESANRVFISAFLAGDSEAVAALYSEDAKVIAPGSEIASGRPAIKTFWQKAIDSGVKELTLTTGTVESGGDLAYEDGTVKQVAPDGQAAIGRYVVVWKRVNGEWKLHRDIWN